MSLKQASGPLGPKRHISGEAPSWAAHTGCLAGAAPKRSHRMDVAAPNKPKEEAAPHLPKANEEVARVNRKAGPASHGAVLATTLRHLAGAAVLHPW
eukprot:g7353.t1